MDERVSASHPAPAELADYFVGLLKPLRESEIEEHFATCRRCAEEGRNLHLLKSVWGGWTARTHAAARRATLLSQALENAAGSKDFEQWRSRLNRWMEQWPGKAEGAVRVILEAQEKGSRILTEGMETLMRPGAMWQFVPEVAGLGRTRSRVATTKAIAVPREGPPVRVQVLGQSVIEVHVESAAGGAEGLLVLLVDGKGASPPRVAQLSLMPEGAGLVARFEAVPRGIFVVALEPRLGTD